MPTADSRGPLTTLLTPFLLVSLTQWLGGVACWLVPSLAGAAPGAPSSNLAGSLISTSLGVSGVVLLVGQRNDPRASLLGAVFLFSASAFATQPLLDLAGSAHGMAPLARALTAFPVEALVPFCLWRFAARFPEALDPPASRTMLRLGGGLSLAVGLLLIAANALMQVVDVPALALVDHRDPDSGFPYFLAGVGLLAFPVIGYRMRRATARDRARARLLALPLALLTALLALVLLANLIAEGGRGQVPVWIWWLLGPFVAASLAVPPALAFAITSRRALHVRIIAPRLFLRTAATVSAAVGLLVAVGLLLLAVAGLEGSWHHPQVPMLAAAFLLLAALLAASWWRQRPRPGSEEHDWATWTAEAPDLDGASGFESWLHRGGRLVGARSVRLLPRAPSATHSRLLAGIAEDPPELSSLFAVRGDALDLETADPLGELPRLPNRTRRWLGDRGIVLLQPVRSPSGDLLAILALGERVDQSPWDEAVRTKVRAMAAVTALVLDREAGDGPLPAGATDEDSAAECPDCARVFAALLERCPDCGRATVLLEQPLLVAGKYQLERTLGRGSLGRVYQARDVLLDRPVALKALARTSPEALRDLSREARAMASLRHPRLATVHGAERTATGLYLVCELLEGGTLEPGPRPWADAVSLVLELLEALRPLHDRDIVHGDLKPSNIGFDGEGRLKLLDFGMTRLVGDTFAPRTPESADLGASMVLPGGHVGTPLYSPPEAWRGESVGLAADLWPVAVLLWQLLTGRHPFDDGGDAPGRASRVRRAIEDDLRPPLADLCECPRPLESIIDRALHPDPARRFVDAPGLERALRKVLAGTT